MIQAETLAGFREAFETVHDYERSWMWRNTKTRYRISGRPMVCFICGDSEVDLHHLGYGNCGHELLDELVPLCEDHHYLVERLIRGRWVSRWSAHRLLERRLAKRAGRDLRRLRAHHEDRI